MTAPRSFSVSRRSMLHGLALSSLLATAPAFAARRSTAQPATGRLLKVNGQRLFVDDSGPRDAPALLYVHGGPGVGSLEFETYMKPFLKDGVRLISVDQRGVLRSDPLPENGEVTATDIVEDFEAIRRELRISQWQVLGHSFGGHFAMRYALRYPKRTSRLILENPAYDVSSSMHWLVASGAQLLNGTNPEAALRAHRLAQIDNPITAEWFEDTTEALAALGEHRQDLYVVQDKNRDMFSRLAAASALTDAQWQQGRVPGLALLHDPEFLEPMLGKPAELDVPILYVRGSGDHATSPEEISALLAAGARFETVQNAGHFIHVEEPGRLADVIKSPIGG